MSDLQKELEIAPTSVQKIIDPEINKFGVNLYLKREDLIHPVISGNKWRKLKYNLLEAQKLRKETILTFGGAYSNHIYAVSEAGKKFGFKTIGIIRGEEHLPLNDTLQHAVDNGMLLSYVDRSSYRNKKTSDFINMLHKKFGDFYLVPEGGSNHLAVKGCTEIVTEISPDFDVVCVACGTGGTLAGIICGLDGRKKAIGFAALKGASFLNDEVKTLISSYNKSEYINWEIQLDYHFGGYAKRKPELNDFIDRFISVNNIEIEWIYTGKMLFGIYDLVRKGYFKRGENILAIHTGGLRVNQ